MPSQVFAKLIKKEGYTKYLDLTDEETYDEVNSVIYNLECIEGIETILDVELLKEHVLNDLHKDIKTKTK